MNKLEAFNEIVRVIKVIKTSNDYYIEHTKTLEMILLNLKIQIAHIDKTQLTGVEPIANELERQIKEMKNRLNSTIKENRKAIEIALMELGKFVKE